MAVSTPPEIRQLPDAVANQVAAGEVIERPANVVKELVENSIDAGASRIVVRIDDGGRRLVEVIDDGHGMRRDDLAQALGRHATSKLHNADDLFRIASLGFRGEALPSIAGVSEFEMASRPHAADAGAKLVLRGDRPVLDAVAMAPGTRVTVRNLFWNVPVRLKFLKTQATETGHVTDMVTRLALGHPHIAFLLESNEKTILDLPSVDELLPRIRSLLGRGVAESLLPVVGAADAHQLHGFIAHPSHAKPTGKRQYVFLNGRHIRDRLVVAAVREGYRGFVEPRLHATVFLHLDIDPSLVDVNVHPTKAEVRFRRDKEVFHLVRSTLRETLEAAGGFSLLGGSTAQPSSAPVTPIKRTVVKPATPVEPVIQERFLPRQAEVAREPAQRYRAPALETPSPSPSIQQPEPALADAAPDPLADVRRIVQLHDMYLLIETSAGIRLIDQHALHEKALYLCLDPAVTDFNAGGRQELLMPITVELSAAQVAACEPHLEALAASGIEADVFGPTSIAVRSHPAILKRLNWEAFFSELADSEDAADPVAELRERIAHRRACRAAVKAGDRLSEHEQRELVRLLYTMEGLEHCPHGRPTTLDLEWDELERRFQR